MLGHRDIKNADNLGHRDTETVDIKIPKLARRRRKKERKKKSRNIKSPTFIGLGDLKMKVVKPKVKLYDIFIMKKRFIC